jgi:hypothetical protein
MWEEMLAVFYSLPLSLYQDGPNIYCAWQNREWQQGSEQRRRIAASLPIKYVRSCVVSNSLQRDRAP